MGGVEEKEVYIRKMGQGAEQKAPMMPSLNNCNNNDARVYESKLGELVEASKDIGSCFFNGNVQGIQKKIVRE